MRKTINAQRLDRTCSLQRLRRIIIYKLSQLNFLHYSCTTKRHSSDANILNVTANQGVLHNFFSCSKYSSISFMFSSRTGWWVLSILPLVAGISLCKAAALCCWWRADGPFYCGRFALPIWGQIICNHACQILSYNVYFILICKTGFQLIDLLLKREGRKAQQLAVLPSNLTGFSTTQQFPSTIKGYFGSASPFDSTVFPVPTTAESRLTDSFTVSRDELFQSYDSLFFKSETWFNHDSWHLQRIRIDS